jgi:hypothetical protein
MDDLLHYCFLCLCCVLFSEQSDIFGMHKKVNSTKKKKNCGIFMTETRLRYLSNVIGFTILSYPVWEIWSSKVKVSVQAGTQSSNGYAEFLTKLYLKSENVM